jgi:hypothetical protein
MILNPNNLDPTKETHLVVVDHVVVAKFPDVRSAFLRAGSIFDMEAHRDDVLVISLVVSPSGGLLCIPTSFEVLAFEEADPGEYPDGDDEDDDEGENFGEPADFWKK